jgi:hypothetical protein
MKDDAYWIAKYGGAPRWEGERKRWESAEKWYNQKWARILFAFAWFALTIFPLIFLILIVGTYLPELLAVVIIFFAIIFWIVMGFAIGSPDS